MSIDPFTGEFERQRAAHLTISRISTDRGPDVCVHLIAAEGTVVVLSLEHMSHFVSENKTRDAILKWIGEMTNTEPAIHVTSPTRFEREEVI
jgi:hypothetical protein